MAGKDPESEAALHAPHQAGALPLFLRPKERKLGLILVLAASFFGLFHAMAYSEGLLFGFVNGVLTGICIASVEVFWVRRHRRNRLRRQSMLLYATSLTVIWSAIILLNITLTRHWLGMDHDLSFSWMLNKESGGQFLFSLMMVVLFNFVMRVSAFLGGGSLMALVLGRYLEPIDEKLAFLILDISGSTKLTEALGDVNTQRLIARFFLDISELIEHYGGEIHRYIGDQMVVTWRYEEQHDFRQLLYCLDAIYRLQAQQRPYYQTQFGAAPEFRVGLHGGHVLVSEVGDQKRELAYFGDTINVAAGLQQQCKEYKAEVLISSSLLQLLTLPPSLEAKFVGSIRFKGKRSPIAAHALSNTSPSAAAECKESQKTVSPAFLDTAQVKRHDPCKPVEVHDGWFCFRASAKDKPLKCGSGQQNSTNDPVSKLKQR